jgi:hypothetical protein
MRILPGRNQAPERPARWRGAPACHSCNRGDLGLVLLVSLDDEVAQPVLTGRVDRRP